MNTSLIRSMTAISFSILAATSSASAGDFGSERYGAAPASLDFETSGDFAADEKSYGSAPSSLDAQKKNAAYREELAFLSPINPFPSDAIARVDPITKKKVDKVLVGPAFKTRGYGSNYDYYRYVTFYKIQKRKEQIYSLPELHSTCDNEKAKDWSGFETSIEYSATVKASVDIKFIGLGAEFTKKTAFKMTQDVDSRGIEADIIPYAIKKDWYGSTYIQLYDSKTGKVAFLDKPTKESPWWVFFFWPRAAKEKYPMDFEVRNASWMFLVEYENVMKCGGTGDFGN